MEIETIQKSYRLNEKVTKIFILFIYAATTPNDGIIIISFVNFRKSLCFGFV